MVEEWRLSSGELEVSYWCIGLVLRCSEVEIK